MQHGNKLRYVIKTGTCILYAPGREITKNGRQSPLLFIVVNWQLGSKWQFNVHLINTTRR